MTVTIFTSTEVNAASSTHGTKWTDYTDPYGRYTIKHPSKWSIQSEPVHSAASQLLEVPLKVSNSHASTLMVSEIKNDVGLSLREFTSFVQNNDFTGVPKKLISPVSCGVISQPGVEVCEYYETYTYGFNQMGHKASLFSDSGNRVFHVEFLFGADEPLSADNINYMVSSFKLLGSNSVAPITTESGVLSDTFAECLLHHNCSLEDKKRVNEITGMTLELPTKTDVQKMLTEGK